MTAEEFERVTGRAPILDDLERVNCPEAGTIRHTLCGICPTCHMPRFMGCDCPPKELRYAL